MKHTFLFIILSFSLSPFAMGMDPSDACEAPPEILEQIRQANSATIESLLDRHPDNFWIQRSYIDFHAGSSYQVAQSLGIPRNKVDASVIERFKANYDRHPDDVRAAYLFAYALIHSDTPKSVEILTDIAAKTPPFPPACMTLAVLHGYAGFREPEKQVSYTESFLACCPNTAEPRIARLALQLEKSDTLTEYTRLLRERIAGTNDEVLLPLFNYLWQLELKTALLAEKKERENRIRGDLAFLEGLDPAKFRQVQSLIIQGYNHIGDTAAIVKFLAQNKQLPSTAGLTLFYRARSEWSRNNPMPPPMAGIEELTNYYEKQLAFLDSWMERIPESMVTLEPRYQALASLPSTSNEILIYEGSRILALARRTTSGSYAPAAINVIKTWADRDILLDRIPSITREITSLQSRTASLAGAATQSDLTGNENTAALLEENRRWTTKTGAWSVLVAVYSKQGEFDQAKNILTEWTNALAERRQKADAIRVKQRQQYEEARASNASRIPQSLFNSLETSIVSEIPRDESKYYQACAELAEAEGRTVDALAFYQSALRMRFRARVSSADFPDIGKMNTAGSLLWTQKGRSQEEWDEWLQSVQPRTRSLPRQAMETRRIPEFSLPDQHGETWTLANLKGKTTLINVWATWCGPCRRELPLLQELYEKTRDRNDIQVVTLNIDKEDTKHRVEPFLKENKFTFPSIYANDFIKEFAGNVGIPLTWITDVDATIRSETLGFRGDNQWVDQTLKQIENINTGAEQPVRP